MMLNSISISAEIDSALSEGQPVVALESTLITHGLPNPETVSYTHLTLPTKA